MMRPASSRRTRRQASDEEVALGAPLAGRRVRLRPVSPADHAWLYSLSTCSDNGFRWRYGGATPNPDAFVHSLWDRVLVQFVAEHIVTNVPVGLVVAYAPDMHSGHVQVAALLEPAVQKQPWPHEAIILLANYLFTNWNFRKLYAESVDFNYRQFASGVGRLFVLEATLRKHQFWNGRYWDKHICACTREVGSTHQERLLRFALGRSRSAPR